jgi:hypothetical protein
MHGIADPCARCEHYISEMGKIGLSQKRRDSSAYAHMDSLVDSIIRETTSLREEFPVEYGEILGRCGRCDRPLKIYRINEMRTARNISEANRKDSGTSSEKKGNRPTLHNVGIILEGGNPYFFVYEEQSKEFNFPEAC